MNKRNKMQFAIKIILLILISVLGWTSFVSSQGAGYVKIQVNQDNVVVGQEIFVQAKLRSSEGAYLSGCKISFGDGQQISGFCNNLKPEQICTRNAWHSYDSPGDYKVKISCGYYSTSGSTGGILKDEEIVKVSEAPEPSPPDSDEINPLETTTLEGIAQSLTGLVFYVLSGLAVLFIMIGGFFIITAGGNPERINKGRKIILFTIIGFVIIAVARGIRALIYQIMEVTL